tara:strand:+ start:7357 stop:9339 length:1983 start_codon:yes stop_codon:yes gene_type:complete
MASNTKIGNLKAVLSMDSKKFDKGAKKAKKSVNGLSKSFGNLKAKLVGVALAGGFGALTKNALSSADAIGKFANRAGVTTEQLQKMRYAFDLAGVGAEAVDKALVTFGKRLGKAHQGIGALIGGLRGGEEALLAKLMATRDVNSALQIMFEEMGKAGHQTRKLAIADAAFGMSGLRMTAAFEDGSEAFFKAQDRAKELGIILDDDLIETIESLNDEMNTLGYVFKAEFAKTMGSGASTALELTKALIKVNEELRKFLETLNVNKGEILAFIAAISALLSMKALGSLIPALGKKTKILKALLPIIAAVTAFIATYEKSATAATNATNKQNKALSEKEKKLRKQLEIEAELAYQEEQREKAYMKSLKTEELEDPETPDLLGNLGEDIDKIRELEKDIKEIFRARSEEIRNTRLLAQGKGHLIRKLDEEKIIKEKIKELDKEHRKLFEESQFQRFTTQKKALQLYQYLLAEQKMANEALKYNQDLARIGESVFDRFGDGIVFSMQRGQDAMQSFRDAAVAALFDVQRELFKMMIFAPLKKAVFGAVGNFLSGGFSFGTEGAGQDFDSFDPDVEGLANGGFARAGRTVLVGERGPELFRPQSSGTVIPNDQMGGTTVVQNISVGVSQTVRAELMGMLPMITDNVKQAVADSRMRGGSFSNAMGA